MSASNIHDRTKPGFVVCEYEVIYDFVISLRDSGVIFSSGAKIFACVFSKNFEVGKFPLHAEESRSSGVLYKVVFFSDSNIEVISELYAHYCLADAKTSLCKDYQYLNFNSETSKLLKYLASKFINEVLKKSDCNDCLRNICEILDTQRHAQVSTNPKVLHREDLKVPKEDISCQKTSRKHM